MYQFVIKQNITSSSFAFRQILHTNFNRWTNQYSDLMNTIGTTSDLVAFSKRFGVSKCTSLSNLVNGFKTTGIYPYNPRIIPEEAFISNTLTENHQSAEPAVIQSVASESNVNMLPNKHQNAKNTSSTVDPYRAQLLQLSQMQLLLILYKVLHLKMK